jgi:hypothetical protein
MFFRQGMNGADFLKDFTGTIFAMRLTVQAGVVGLTRRKKRFWMENTLTFRTFIGGTLHKSLCNVTIKA